MKTSSLLSYRKYGAVGVAVLSLLALPVVSRADDKKDDKDKKRDDHAEHGKRDDHPDHGPEKRVDHAEKKADHVVDHAKKDAERMADHGDKRAAEKRVDQAEHRADHIVDHAEKKADHVVHEEHKDAVRHEEIRRADPLPRDRRGPPGPGPTVAVERHHAPTVVVHREHPAHVVHDPHVVEWRHSHPGWVLSLGNGWRGRGYYWGPPGVAFYSESPGVTYYASGDEVPVEYESEVTETTTEPAAPATVDVDAEVGAAVQKALTEQGYYKGAVDGQIGPMSQRAIKRYQSDHGMDPTGLITGALLKSLGID